MSEIPLNPGDEATPLITAVLEPALPASIAYIEKWMGADAMQYLENTGHQIYCYKGDQESETMPVFFHVCDSDRIISLQIIPRNPLQPENPNPDNTIINCSFLLEDDFIGQTLDETLGNYLVTRKQLSGNTLSFLDFCFDVLKRINKNTIVVLKANDDTRFRIYDNLLQRIQRPANIVLESE